LGQRWEDENAKKQKFDTRVERVPAAQEAGPLTTTPMWLTVSYVLNGLYKAGVKQHPASNTNSTLSKEMKTNAVVRICRSINPSSTSDHLCCGKATLNVMK